MKTSALQIWPWGEAKHVLEGKMNWFKLWDAPILQPMLSLRYNLALKFLNFGPNFQTLAKALTSHERASEDAQPIHTIKTNGGRSCPFTVGSGCRVERCWRALGHSVAR